MRYGKYRMIRDKGKWSDLYSSEGSYFGYSKGTRMDTLQTMEERLWDYIDGLSSPGEKTAIEQLISDNREWQLKYRELLDVHQAMGIAELEEPSMRFTKNVMEEITKYQVAPAARNYINKHIIRAIGAFFLVMILGFFIYVMGQVHWVASNSSSLVPQYNINAERLNLGKVLSGPYAMAFTMVTAILGLVLLDRVLQAKREQRIHKGYKEA